MQRGLVTLVGVALVLTLAGCSSDFAPPDATVDVTNPNDYVVWPVPLTNGRPLEEALGMQWGYISLRPGETVELRVSLVGGGSDDGGCNSSEQVFVRSRSGRTDYWIGPVLPTAQEIETDFEVIDSWPAKTTCWPSRSNEYQLLTVE